MTQKCFKFSFFAFLDHLKLALKFPCSISVIWKRGQKLAEVKQRKQIVEGVAVFKQQLVIQCNMIFDDAKKKFQPKKTIFTVLIFTQKGTKQAGQVEIDVSDLLNNKEEQKEYQCSLLKCPDKNAKLFFKIRPSFKQQIKSDAISQRSLKSVDIQKVAGTINLSEANFKKKPKASEQQTSQNQTMNVKNTKTQTLISLSKQDLRQLQLENKTLKEQVKESRKQVDKIKKSISNSQIVIIQQKKKCQQYEGEIRRLKQVSRAFNDLQSENRMLQSQVLTSKLKLAEIFNKAFQIGGANLADRLQQACGYIEH